MRKKLLGLGKLMAAGKIVDPLKNFVENVDSAVLQKEDIVDHSQLLNIQDTFSHDNEKGKGKFETLPNYIVKNNNENDNKRNQENIY
jgi:hypothetical protein